MEKTEATMASVNTYSDWQSKNVDRTEVDERLMRGYGNNQAVVRQEIDAVTAC
jgi:hypothetical protein